MPWGLIPLRSAAPNLIWLWPPRSHQPSDTQCLLLTFRVKHDTDSEHLQLLTYAMQIMHLEPEQDTEPRTRARVDITKSLKVTVLDVAFISQMNQQRN